MNESKKTKVALTESMGRGVFAAKTITPGELVEFCDVIVLNRKDSKTIENTILSKYVFYWRYGQVVIALGCGSLFNHSEHANVDWHLKFDNGIMVGIEFFATRLVMLGDQLMINYGDEYIETRKSFK